MKAASLTYGNTRTFVEFAELVKELKAFWDNDQGEKEEITVEFFRLDQDTLDELVGFAEY